MTVHLAGTGSHFARDISVEAEQGGYGIRQYDSLDLMKKALPAEPCVILLLQTDRFAQFRDGLAELKHDFPVATVISLATTSSVPDVVELMQLGAYSVVVLPLQEGQLIKTLNAAVEHSHTEQCTQDRAREATVRMQQANHRELEVLELILKGQKNRQIADHLGITVRAVEDRRYRLMKKTGVQSVAELAALSVHAEYFRPEQGQ